MDTLKDEVDQNVMFRISLLDADSKDKILISLRSSFLFLFSRMQENTNKQVRNMKDEVLKGILKWNYMH